MSIYLVRHGETLGNATRVVQTPEMVLNERGVDQARRLARRLAEERIAKVLSSHLVRAVMTARTVASATGAELELSSDLQERSFGDLRGLAYSDIGADIMAPGFRPPGGESWEELHARVDRIWEKISHLAARLDGGLVVVTHGLVCSSVVARHVALAPEMRPPERWGNTSLTVIEPSPPWRVRLLNCTRHLDGAVAEDERGISGI